MDYFLALPNHPDLAKLKLSASEWQVLSDFHRILDNVSAVYIECQLMMISQVPHVVQHRVSGEKLPRLGLSVPYFELFMTGWEELRDDQPRLKPWIKVSLDWAGKYYNRMDETTAYVIAMCMLYDQSYTQADMIS